MELAPISLAEVIALESVYPFHSPNSGRLADILGVMLEW